MTKQGFRAAVLVGVLLCTQTACGESSQSNTARASTLSIANAPDLGRILVDGKKETLYIFEPDAARDVTCTFTCATNWPPLIANPEGLPSAGDGVKGELIGKRPNPSGGDVVTYNGWTLYRYSADHEPGQIRGQDLELNGGTWYVMTADGSPLFP